MKKVTLGCNMKIAVFSILVFGILTVPCRATKKTSNDEKIEVVDKVEEPKVSNSSFTIPSILSFSMPDFSIFRLPFFQALANTGRVQSSRATKTEFIEVTRRQTAHPVCYTAYQGLPPCLPYEQGHRTNENDDLELKAEYHHANSKFEVNEIKKSIKATPTIRLDAKTITGPVNEGSLRNPKYLELKLFKDRNSEDEQIMGSEIAPSVMHFRGQQQFEPKEAFTKTVLITKLEKYMDHRVTATLLAMGCYPVDQNIPLCQSYSDPINRYSENKENNF